VRTLGPPNTSSAPTSVGASLLLVSPRPSWPENPAPHVHSLPLLSTANGVEAPGGHRNELAVLKHLCSQQRRHQPIPSSQL
jgi:hypothetical protein